MKLHPQQVPLFQPEPEVRWAEVMKGRDGGLDSSAAALYCCMCIYSAALNGKGKKFLFFKYSLIKQYHVTNPPEGGLLPQFKWRTRLNTASSLCSVCGQHLTESRNMTLKTAITQILLLLLYQESNHGLSAHHKHPDTPAAETLNPENPSSWKHKLLKNHTHCRSSAQSNQWNQSKFDYCCGAFK